MKRHREAFKRFWTWISRRKGEHGHPRVVKDVRDAIRRLAKENPTWGAPRIHGELVTLGFQVSERTVARYLPKRERNPDKRARWMAFLRNHREAIAAMDLFVVPTATFRLLYGLIVIEHGRRCVLNWAVTEHPTAEWVVRVLRDAFSYDEGPECMIHDRDARFGARVKEAIKRMGTRSKQTAFHCPWQNPIAERFIGSIRRDLLDHVVILGQDHLARLLGEYIRYYHADRTHLGLDKDCPEPRTVMPRPSEDAELVALPRVGGIHHRYEWRVPA